MYRDRDADSAGTTIPATKPDERPSTFPGSPIPRVPGQLTLFDRTPRA